LVSTTSHEINSKQKKERDGISEIGGKKKERASEHTTPRSEHHTYTSNKRSAATNSMNITMSF
jgi:hypothetical protein